MMTGLDVEDGQLVEFFEFRHLTFQEFLSARAIVEGWHPGRQDNDVLVTAIAPYLGDEKWREVIPLAASLGGKETEALITRLTDSVEASNPDSESDSLGANYYIALGRCLADEAAAKPETVRRALRSLVSVWVPHRNESVFQSIAQGRYGKELFDEAGESFFGWRILQLQPRR